MNRTEQLLVILSEECAEVSKEVSKALRFGLNDRELNSIYSNREKIANEFNDLFAVMLMLKEDGIFTDGELLASNSIESKKVKVEKWLKYSKKVGTLS